MNKYAIFGDSTCDLTTEQRSSKNIEYARMYSNWTDKDKNQHEIFADLDWSEIKPTDYYNMMRDGITILTSQVNEEEFDRKFIPHFEKGEDILYIACSSKLSASGRQAQNLWNEKYSKNYPKCKLIVIDSLNSVMGQGLMCMDAADMRDKGMTIEEVAKVIEETKLTYNQTATVEDLTTLAKHGRVKASTAFFGNIFGVKPIIISDAVGNNFAVEKCKGRRNALMRIAAIIKERVVSPETQTCYISEADVRPEDLELLISQIKEIGFKDVVTQKLGPIISASCGPATLGCYYKGKPEDRVGE